MKQLGASTIDVAGRHLLLLPPAAHTTLAAAANPKLQITPYASTAGMGNGPNGDPLACKMDRPHGIFVNADDSVFVANTNTHRVRVIRKAKRKTRPRDLRSLNPHLLERVGFT